MVGPCCVDLDLPGFLVTSIPTKNWLFAKSTAWGNKRLFVFFGKNTGVGRDFHSASSEATKLTLCDYENFVKHLWQRADDWVAGLVG